MVEELITLAEYEASMKKEISADELLKVQAVFKKLVDVYAYDYTTSYPKDALISNFELVYADLFKQTDE